MHMGGEGEEMQIYSFLTSALDRGCFQAPASLTIGKNPGTHLDGSQMGPQAVSDVLPILEFELPTIQPVA